MLAGTRVLDLTSLVPGAYATGLLADLGAEVIKLEPPGPSRFPALEGWAAAVLGCLDRNKKSVAVDLKHPRGLAMARALAATCDVLIEGFRPGVADRLGLGYPELAASSPGLIYCSLTGYGQTGPRAQEAGHDLNYLALSGLLSLFGEAGRPPPIPPILLADLAGGAAAALAVLAAVVQRRNTGRGARVDVAMVDVLASWLRPLLTDAAPGQVLTREDLPLAGRYVCYNVWATRDHRYVALAALERRFWTNFCNAVGRGDLVSGQFSSARRGDPVHDELEALFRSRTLQEWADLGTGQDLCLTPVLDPPEAMAGELARARGFGRQGLPFRCEGWQPPDRPAPRRGQHTREVLGALGLAAAELEALAHQGVVLMSDEGGRETCRTP